MIFILLGTFCELQIDYCASLPCMNGAMCSNVLSRGMLSNAIETHEAMATNVSSNFPIRKPFLCKCPPEFHGAECEVSEIVYNYIRLFYKRQCKNIPLQDYFNSRQMIIYFQFDVDECLESPCLNGGQCINDLGSFECICSDGFRGKSKNSFGLSLIGTNIQFMFEN